MKIQYNTIETMDGKEYTRLDLSIAKIRVTYINDNEYNADLVIELGNRTEKWHFKEQTQSEIMDFALEYLVLHTTFEEVTEFEKKQILRQWRFK